MPTPNFTPRTNAEESFLRTLLDRLTNLDVRAHETPKGEPWVLVSTDFIENGAVHDTLRLDFDGEAIKGGWSPAFLNWDDGVQASEAGIDISPPEGIDQVGSPEELATAAIGWFEQHMRAWPDSERRARWQIGLT